MFRTLIILACLLPSTVLRADDKKPPYPSFDYDTARTHEIKPHRRTIRIRGVHDGFNTQLHLTLIVSPTGDVTNSEADGEPEILKLWPQLQGEVAQWKFTPFQKNGKAVTAEVEEYIDLVPPERLPKHHVVAPVLHPNSKVAITLERTGCFGTCPAYTVTVGTDGLIFDGRAYVVATGKHTANVDADEVRELAKKFIAADFYSMAPSYRARVTDNPAYVVSISIDGQKKGVEDYVGSWVGMPEVIADLEDEVDAFAHTERWIEGGSGLVPALKSEEFNFGTFDAQMILKKAASNGKTETVQELLEAGVPLKPIPSPKSNDQYRFPDFDEIGFLDAASRYPEALRVLINAKASKEDQNDKDLGLIGAAQSGNVAAAKMLLAYGANPNADLAALTVTEKSGHMTMQGSGSGSLLIYAAESGNPEMVRLILSYHPQIKARDQRGRTAIFAAVHYRSTDEDGARVKCVGLLADAGADVNAQDENGNTPLHETFLTDVEEELIKLGANVNARNKDGETPIFTTVNDDAIPLFIEHGADLTIRNNKGQTVMEAAEGKGPVRQEALRLAILKLNQR